MWHELIQDFNSQLSPQMWQMVFKSTRETIYMGLASTGLSVLFGVPLGLLTFLTSKGQILENRPLSAIFDVIINIGRSIPFIILLILLLPFTRMIVGTTLGTTAAIVPLAITAIPFVARLTANALTEIPTGLTESAHAMGATNWQIIAKYYLPESLPTLINAMTLTLVTLIGYSAMAGVVGGGGLGNLAISYGEHRGMVYVKWIATIIIVAIVIIFQKMGDTLAGHFDHR